MSIKFQKLTPEEIKEITQSMDTASRIHMNSDEVSKFLKIKKSTLYSWVHYGYLEGTYRKRGKHLVFLTDRFIEKVFNGKDWDYPYKT